MNSGDAEERIYPFLSRHLEEKALLADSSWIVRQFPQLAGFRPGF